MGYYEFFFLGGGLEFRVRLRVGCRIHFRDTWLAVEGPAVSAYHQANLLWLGA